MVPSSTDSLENSHKHDSVHIQVVVNAVEESEAPVEAEKGSTAGTDNANNDGDNELGEFLAQLGVLNNNNGTFDHGES